MSKKKLEEILDGKYWRKEDAERVLEALRRSGESVPAFARRHGVGPERIAYWQERVAEVEAPVLVPMIVRAAAPTASVGVAVTVAIGGVRVEVADAARVPPAWLAALVGALGGAA